MAVYKIFPLQDASIYSFYPDMNTGIDAIIEVGNLNVNIQPVPQVFRFLVEFDQTEINNVIDQEIQGTQFSSSLKCFIANAQGVDHNSNLEIFPVSGSWRNGTGTYLDIPITTNGCSWNDRNFSGSGAWDTEGTLITDGTLSFTGGGDPSDHTGTGNITDDAGQSTANVTIVSSGGSITSVTVNSSDATWGAGDTVTLTASDLIALGFSGNPDLSPLIIFVSPNNITFGEAYVAAYYSGSTSGGGNWYTGSLDETMNIKVSQSFTLRSEKDLNVNVTDIVQTWYSSSKNATGAGTTFTKIVNDGFIVKWEDAIEFNTADAIQPIMQFYSVDTNTIYPPTLEISWDDQVFSPGGISEIYTTDFFAALDSNPGIFYSESINRFRVNVRPQFPVRIFQTASIDTTNYYLNSSSLYSVKDLDTNETVINFDDQFTKLSCDSSGNYFDLYMNGLEPERYYKILIQTTINGSTIVKDDNYIFKVVNR